MRCFILTPAELWNEYQHLIRNPEVRVIQLLQGLFTIVDRRFFASLSKQGWSPQYLPAMGLYYVRSTIKGISKTYIHREVMHLADEPFEKVDHRNGDTLDNRLENLEKTSSSSNGAKADRRALGATGFKGVQMRGTKFRGRFTYERKTFYTETVRTADEAVEARKQMMALKCPDVRELSVQESERLARLRNIITQMRAGKLDYKLCLVPNRD